MLLPPFLLFALGALFMAVARREARGTIMVLVPALGLANLLLLPAGASMTTSACGYEMVLFSADKLSMLFLVLFHVAALIAGLFSAHLDRPGQHVACLLYAGSAIGAVAAGDLVSLFLFWEVMAVSSAFLIWGRKHRSLVARGQPLPVLADPVGSSAPGGHRAVREPGGHREHQRRDRRGRCGWAWRAGRSPDPAGAWHEGVLPPASHLAGGRLSGGHPHGGGVA